MGLLDDDVTAGGTRSGEEIMRAFLPTSPFAGYLGLRLSAIQPDEATLTMPYVPALATIGSMVHGGAIASLMDTAAMVAAWSGAQAPEKLRGSTVGLTVNYLAPAVGEDLHATARVLHRGRSLVQLDIAVKGASGVLVAQGLATYKIG